MEGLERASKKDTGEKWKATARKTKNLEHNLPEKFTLLPPIILQ